jgi:hypothetical protein
MSEVKHTHGANYAAGRGASSRDDAKFLRYFAASLTYNDTKAEGEAKHRLHEIAMRIETGYYAKAEGGSHG